MIWGGAKFSAGGWVEGNGLDKIYHEMSIFMLFRIYYQALENLYEQAVDYSGRVGGWDGHLWVV